MALTIFYAWQSDTHRKANHDLIREALEEAIKALNAKAIVEEPMRLDHDTKGKSGTPHVADTILEKIRNCDIFVADLTCVGKTRGRRSVNGKLRRKRMPNPNVMMEAGYASAVIPWSQIVHVMNTGFGEPKHLPFDLKHRRFPITYNLPHEPGRAPEPAKIEKAKKHLAEIFQTAIGDIIEKGVTSSRAEEEKKVAEARLKARVVEISNERRSFEDRVSVGKFHGFPAKFGVIALSIIPEAPTGEQPYQRQPEQILRKYLTPMGLDNGTTLEPDSESVFCRLPPCGSATSQVTELTEFGSLYAARDCWVLSSGVNPEDSNLWAFGYHQQQTNKFVSLYLQGLKTFGVQGPWHIGITLQKIKLARFAPSPSWEFYGMRMRQIADDTFAARSVVVNPPDDVSTLEGVDDVMKAAWQSIWNKAGVMRRPMFDSHGDFIKLQDW